MSAMITSKRTSSARHATSWYRRIPVHREIHRIDELLEPARLASQRWRAADDDLKALTDFYLRSREYIGSRRERAERDIRHELMSGEVVGAARAARVVTVGREHTDGAH